jgi:adenosylcobinamide-phosphate synthase
MLISSSALWVLVGALIVDALIGDPAWLWRRVPHPVTWLGALVDGLDGALNRATWSEGLRRGAGALALLLLAAIAAWIGWEIETGLRRIPYGEIPLAIVASVFLAQRSLYQHVGGVHAAFVNGGLTEARRAVAQIVGRDPASLDESGVSRAAIESCAENFSDGVVAPAFWFALLGLPGLIAYKAVNTADSMIGQRTARHEAFGWASARFDDLVNLVPARLSGLLIALVSGKTFAALSTMRRDARLHRSPNAGWPESAMAAALGVALAGPRRYGERVVTDPFINASGRAALPDDIARSLRVLIAACLLHAALYAALAFSL